MTFASRTLVGAFSVIMILWMELFETLVTAQISGHGAVALTLLVSASSLGQETELENKKKNRVKIIHPIIQLTNYLVSGFTVFICV